MSATRRRGITVVVPAYGDIPSLLVCLRSVMTELAAEDRLLAVNDCGPDADELERQVLAAIDGEPRAAYHRNERNLGFVETCNRAALELDDTSNDVLLLNSDAELTPGSLSELSAVLHQSNGHGVVCPRSNNATIASLPFRLVDPSAERTPERTAAVHAAVVGELARFTVTPVAMGFCFLVRRELLAEFGLFDDAFSPGYGEENDFCLRVNAAGYLSLIANRALVYHHGGRSFGRARRAALRAAHGRLLSARYPFYDAAVRDFLAWHVGPVETFADIVAPAAGRAPRILLHLDSIAAADVAVARGLSTSARIAPAAVVDIVASPATRRLVGLGGSARVHDAIPGDRVYDSGVFGIAVTRGTAALLSRACARWTLVLPNSPARWDRIVSGSADRADALRVLSLADGAAAGSDPAAEGATSWRTAAGAGPFRLVVAADDDSRMSEILEQATAPLDLPRLRERWLAFAPGAGDAVTPAPSGIGLLRRRVVRGVRRRLKRVLQR